MKLHWVAGVAACTVALLGAAPAHAAAPRTAVESVSATPEGLDVRVRAVDLPDGVELDPEAVTVRLDGRVVPATAELAPVQPNGDDVRRVMLVLDTSGSMAGARMPAALGAIRMYLDEVPADVEVGLVTFARDVAVAVPATLDRERLRAELDRVRPEGGTSLYDAVLAAKDALGAEGERRILVLSDGEDTDSAESLNAVLAGMSGLDVPVDSVVLGDEPAAAAVLQQVADQTTGRLLLAADATGASAAFASAAKAFGTRLLLHVPVPAALAGRPAALSIVADTTTGAVPSAPVPVALPAAPVTTAPEERVAPSNIGLVAGLVALFAGLAGALCLAISSGDTVALRRKRTRIALEAYGSSQQPERAASTEPQSRLGDGAVIRTAVELAGRAVESRGLEERLALWLDRAGMRFTPGEWVVVQVTAATVSAALTFLLAGSVLTALAVAVVVALAVHLTLKVKAQRRAAAFLAAMPDALQLVASGLSSGYSLPQALDAAVRDGEDPVATEFGRALAEARLGVPLESALESVAERMDSRDFSWVVMAVRIQREVGGNLSEVLETLCRTLRDRQALRRQVAALSAEGRLSAYILIGLPILLAMWFSYSRPEYFGLMYTTVWGWGMLAGSAVALTLGALWMQKLVKVEM